MLPTMGLWYASVPYCLGWWEFLLAQIVGFGHNFFEAFLLFAVVFFINARIQSTIPNCAFFDGSVVLYKEATGSKLL